MSLKHKRAVFVTARQCLLRLFFFVDFDHFATLVVSAIWADSVRQAHRSAIAASHQVARRQRIMGAATIATTLG
jgi:hypothetical protein